MNFPACAAMPIRNPHGHARGTLYLLQIRCKPVLRNLFSPLLALALLAGGMAAPAAYGQDKLFDDTPKKDGGWQGLANVLEALAPSADTSIPLTPSQITDRISGMITQGKYQEALDIIKKRSDQREAEGAIGTDVQLLFLEGRALSGLNRHDEAIAVYQNMTVQYPELPEPWNNLATEYIKQGKLDMAHDALAMALTADPNYATAKANMGEVQLMLAKQSFDRAAALGIAGARDKAEKTQAILQK